MSHLEHAFGLTFDFGEFSTESEVHIYNHLTAYHEARQQEPKEEQARLQRLLDEVCTQPPIRIAHLYLDLIEKVLEAHQKDA